MNEHKTVSEFRPIWEYPPSLRDFVNAKNEIDSDPDFICGDDGDFKNQDEIIDHVINDGWFYRKDFGPAKDLFPSAQLWLAELPGGQLVRVDHDRDPDRCDKKWWTVSTITIDQAVQIMNPPPNPSSEQLARYEALVPGLAEAVRRFLQPAPMASPATEMPVQTDTPAPCAVPGEVK